MKAVSFTSHYTVLNIHWGISTSHVITEGTVSAPATYVIQGSATYINCKVILLLLLRYQGLEHMPRMHRCLWGLLCNPNPPPRVRRLHVHTTREILSARGGTCGRECWPVIMSKCRFPCYILGSFMCYKSPTWDRRLYFPSEGRCVNTFSPDGVILLRDLSRHQSWRSNSTPRFS
jgi:hypothetical protein